MLSAGGASLRGVGVVWTLGTWRESRTDFRSFRLDCISRVALGDRRVVEEPDKGLNDFLKKMRAERSGE
jgi:predicted DNA-binding transcriptional regulator YafY